MFGVCPDALMLLHSSKVRSLVDPPAPHVISMNTGLQGLKSKQTDKRVMWCSMMETKVPDHRSPVFFAGRSLSRYASLVDLQRKLQLTGTNTALSSTSQCVREGYSSQSSYFSLPMREIRASRFFLPSSVLGGKYSKLTDRSPLATFSAIKSDTFGQSFTAAAAAICSIPPIRASCSFPRQSILHIFYCKFTQQYTKARTEAHRRICCVLNVRSREPSFR